MIRVVSIMESDFVTGPAKSCWNSPNGREALAGLPGVEVSTATYQRGAGDPAANGFVAAARGRE